MLENPDMELLQEYASRNSESAFATLVSRHIDLVYSAALRHTGNHHQAEEITQAVFVILARKAGSLSARTILPGWLFQTTRLTAANYLRTEIRRARREQEAYMQSTPDENSTELWQQLAPALNDAIADLGEKDRNAIVLRFLKGKDFKEVGAALGATEEAAQMRVGRALEKLRKLFARRGVTLSAAALGSLMAAQATQAAPVGFAAAVAAGAMPGTALTASTVALVKGTLKIMTWTKIQLAAGAGVLLLLAYQQQQNTAQARQLTAAREELRSANEAFATQTNRIAALDQQTMAIVEVRRSQEAELERLRARRSAGTGADRSNAAGVPATLLSATLQDPEARELLRNSMISNCRFRFGPAIEEFRLSEADSEKLLQIGGDWAMKNLETVAAFTDGKITAEAAARAEIETELASTNRIRLLLGETNMAKFDEIEGKYPARLLVREFDKLRGVFRIDEAQRSQLARLIEAEPYEIASGLAGDVTIRAIVYPDEWQRRLEQQAAANQRILQGAAEFLPPDQVEALRLMQVNHASSHRREILRMLRKL
jgi:RNA polymerase sigma factor (sigma-70 family)